MHSQVWIKVNTTVDEGIADFIALLNKIDGLSTLDSCQGDKGWGYVYFRYGDWENLGHFIFDTLAPLLHEIREIEYRIQSIDGDEPMAKIGFRTDTIKNVVSVLKNAV